MLLGFGLAIREVLALGWGGAAVIVVTLSATFVGTLAAGRAMRIPELTRLYVATGFAICGAAAIAAMQGVVAGRTPSRGAQVPTSPASGSAAGATADPADPPRDDVALGTALALVTAYGLVLIPLLPWLAGLMGLSDEQAGLWIGASMPEVAQVVAAGGLVSAAGLAAATVSKLARVALLAPMVAIVSIVGARGERKAARDLADAAGAVDGPRGERSASAERPAAGTRPPIVPLFVLGFVAAAVVGSTGVVPDGALHLAARLSTLLLAAAMFALGTTVNIPVLLRSGRPALGLGAIASVIAVGVALGGTLLIG